MHPSEIDFSSPGSWPANWLQGNPNIIRPFPRISGRVSLILQIEV